MMQLIRKSKTYAGMLEFKTGIGFTCLSPFKGIIASYCYMETD